MEKIGKITQDDYIKANRKASREIELDNSSGWVSKNRTHKNFKKYNRNDKSWEKELFTERDLKSIIREAIEDYMDEANYPSSFNMEEFKGLRSFNHRLNYCKEHLEPISSGSGRYVFGIDYETVLKLAKNQKGVAQNEAEYEYSNDGYIGYLIADVYEADENFLWIEMERLMKCTPRKFFQSTGMKFPEFVQMIKHEVDPKTFRASDIDYDWWENDFFRDIIDFIKSFDVVYGDFTRLSSYGVTKNGEVKIIDAGLSKEVYNTYYKKK